MKLRHVLLLTAGPLLLAACSSTATEQAQTLTAPSATASPSPSPAASTASADLKAALLTLSDLPAGWSPYQTSNSSGGTASCPALNNGAWKKLPQAADADFSQGQVGPFLIEQIAAGTSDPVTAAWQAFAHATSQCATFTQKTSQGTNTYTLAALSFPKYGDATYAFALTVQQDAGLSASGDVVVARKGNVLVQMTVFGLGSVPVSQVEDLVGRQSQKPDSAPRPRPPDRTSGGRGRV